MQTHEQGKRYNMGIHKNVSLSGMMGYYGGRRNRPSSAKSSLHNALKRKIALCGEHYLKVTIIYAYKI